MGRRRLFQLSARHKRRLVKKPNEIFEENLNSDLVQAEGENIYSEQVFEEDLEEIEVGSNTSESKIEKLKSAGGSEVATVVESILKKLMTDDLQAKYSLYGEKGKNSLVKVKGLRQLIKDAVAAHPRTPNYPDEGTVDEEIQKSLKKVADRVGKRMRNRYELLHAHRIQDEIVETYRRNRFTILYRFAVESADISLRYLLEFISKVGNSRRIRYRYESEYNIET
ncbi:hypothetical protein Fcan01_05923 [Folsomia candida]|uniref:Uncharacterized protein n=1 Tax=Folsomia candida TaxID=158441 RepID=A0A226EPI3_FOLCA|nr:hypothetical protein Fcan01_05923 [Folsomia candida]